MSIKSLLQIILFLLIIIIIGGLYFLYFYSGPLKVQSNETALININKSNSTLENIDGQEILDEVVSENQQDNVKNKNISKNIDTKNPNKKIKSKNKLENLTRDIEYITSNSEGDIFKIFAKFGKTNPQNSDILNLEIVNGTIERDKSSEILISSNYAEYNYSNQNSKFYENVKIKYQDKIISCDNLDIIISENIVVGYNNVTIVDDNSSLKAKKITMNILTKDIEINSDDKIQITTN